MSNIMGKALLGAKKIGQAVGKFATEIGTTIGGAASELGDYTKKVAKVSMFKAEMDGLYSELGKSVFMDGLTPNNEKAMELMNKLYELDAQVTEMEKEIKQDVPVECSCDDNCPREGECHCEDTEVPTEEKSEDSENK